MISDLWDRISFAAEGVWLRTADAAAAIRHSRLGLAIAGAVAVAVAVVAVVLVGGGESGSEATTAAPVQLEPPSVISDPQLVEEKGFSIAVPDAWHRTKPPEGASFAAASDDGLGKATLWVDRDPKLDFDEFVDQSLAGLEGLGDNAEVTDRVDGPSPETSIAVAGPYRVTLRAAGPYRYYLATAIGAGAPPRLVADAELLSTSFRPQVEENK